MPAGTFTVGAWSRRVATLIAVDASGDAMAAGPAEQSGDDGHDEAGGRETDDGGDGVGAREEDGHEESMPPFLRYGILTVVVYGVAVTALVELSSVDVQGPTLVAFTVGFLVFMTVYFGSMWLGWLFLD